MSLWTDAGRDAAHSHMSVDLYNARATINKLIRECDEWAVARNEWRAYAHELENMIVEIGSQLEASCLLAEKIIEAINNNGDGVILEKTPAGDALRKKVIEQGVERSKMGMIEAHQARLKENPEAGKTVAIKKMYHPETGRAPALFYKLFGNKPALKSSAPSPATQAGVINKISSQASVINQPNTPSSTPPQSPEQEEIRKHKNHIRSLALKLVASNELIAKLVVGSSGLSTPEERKAFFEASKQGMFEKYGDTNMIAKSADDIKEQEVRIYGGNPAPVQRPARKT
jgi:hypothetical protein